MTIFSFVFKRFFRKKSNSIFLLALPIGAVFLPTFDWPPIPLGFHYYSLLLLFIASRLSAILIEDRTDNILLRVSAAPITHFQYLWQNLLAYTAILTGVNAMFLIVGSIVHGGSLPSPFLFFIIYTVFSMTALGFTLTWYSLFRDKEAAFSTLGGLIVLMAMLGGVMWPVEAMPELLHRAVMFLPTYWAAEATLLLASGATVKELLIPLAVMLLFCFAFLLAGSRKRLA
ncbi:ABC transporter permease [Alteribacillus sp. HJP-4]|uniref:ABC transporter permease n=1 Tax=Alteribacillus sp. HJP-4 TaxID=2775394 RepID=UPI0035CD3442